MPIFRYFSEQRFADSFITDGQMRFGSLASYRAYDDGGVRGDPKDGALHYAPPDGLEITMVKDGRKLTGMSFTTAAENMFVYCVSNEPSDRCAKELGSFCVEISDPEEIVARLKARACRTSKLDYAQVSFGPVEYRPLDAIPGVEWAFPERVVLMKPPEYDWQNESRFVLPLKPHAQSADSFVKIEIGSLEHLAKRYRC
ncbi:hypothetical protein OLX02_14010 [Novosphingobium sp. KCTC 2891]|uniref:hypothetical protein n=1 Tax=Novosphingobium sp. KCTC 2891 TaxID=2989730 RepID=UPI002222668B|nr:hypothetical protein [Novosphingobium sp. KCTC 2891]MCW1383934.1 hypothetical protein [Novosphingobium sp. KCTC 2891]